MAVYVLDTGPLTRILHPKKPDNIACYKWYLSERIAGSIIALPEIVDYESRRALLKLFMKDNKKTPESPSGFAERISILNKIRSASMLLTINSAVMYEAAELWAYARKINLAGTDEKALDSDVILIASVRIHSPDAVIVTENLKDFKHFHPATFHWNTLSPK